tara:strand:- start:230 stop:697 length:468 start_codon:yes stop_codon:yes gene_type:complete
MKNISKPLSDPLAVSLFSEISTIEHLLKLRLTKMLPTGMEPSHFAILNHFSVIGGERTPAQLAKSFNVTKGAITNTLNKLGKMGYVHIRPDWSDGRRKLVSISQAGINAREEAISSIEPVIGRLMRVIGAESARSAIPFLRELRILLNNENKSNK